MRGWFRFRSARLLVLAIFAGLVVAGCGGGHEARRPDGARAFAEAAEALAGEDGQPDFGGRSATEAAAEASLDVDSSPLQPGARTTVRLSCPEQAGGERQLLLHYDPLAFRYDGLAVGASEGTILEVEETFGTLKMQLRGAGGSFEVPFRVLPGAQDGDYLVTLEESGPGDRLTDSFALLRVGPADGGEVAVRADDARVQARLSYPMTLGYPVEGPERYTARDHTDAERLRYALDFNRGTSDEGDWILASADGTVVESVTGLPNGQKYGYGNRVKIRHDNGYYTLYAHLKGSDQVARGARVRRGQRIGRLGNSGYSTGAHLHFEFQNPSGVRVQVAPYQMTPTSHTVSGAPIITTVPDTIFENRPDYSCAYVSQNAYPTLTRGQAYEFRLKMRNTGGKTWTPDMVRLGTSGPQDRVPAFQREGGWISSNRVRMVQGAVAPGEEADFVFTYRVPNNMQHRTYREYFRLVADGVTWMEDFGIYWDIHVVDFSRNPGDYSYDYSSQSGYPLVVAGHTADFWLKIVNRGPATWKQGVVNLGTDRPQDRPARFPTGSGWTSSNRVRMVQGQVAPGETGEFRFSYRVPGATASGAYREYFRPVADGVTWMQDRGIYWDVLVLRPASGAEMRGDQALVAGASVQSPSGSYRLVYQADGNLVLYKQLQGYAQRALWASNTNGRPGKLAVMQMDGNLVLYGHDDRPIWATNTNGNSGSRLIVQNDGNVVVYRPNGTVVWATNTNGR